MIWYYGFVRAIVIQENSGLELTSTITLVLQANGLTKCASYPEKSMWEEDNI